MVTSSCGSMMPEFGLTQYLLGAVVLILKQTLRSDGFNSFITEDTADVNGPEEAQKNKNQWLNRIISFIAMSFG